MMRNEKGLTLVEVLLSLVIVSIISGIIIHYLMMGMKNYQKVNSEIMLHDEANYVMSQFVNYLFVAVEAKNVNDPNPCTSLVTVKNIDGDVTTLGFENNKAVINGNVISRSNHTFSCDPTSSSKIEVQGNNVVVKMFVEDEQSEYDLKIELNSRVSYLNVNN